MVINWYGESCFKIQSGEIVILTDPLESSGGLTPPRFKTDTVLKTVAPELLSYPNNEITGPGEYEIKGVEIKGLPNKSSTVYLVKFEEMKIGFLGQLKENLEPSVLEKMDEIDILFIPAGGSPYLGQKEAAQILKKTSPKITITSLFKIPGLKRKADDIKEFLKEVEQKSEPQEKLVIKKSSLPQKTQVVVLKV